MGNLTSTSNAEGDGGEGTTNDARVPLLNSEEEDENPNNPFNNDDDDDEDDDADEEGIAVSYSEDTFTSGGPSSSRAPGTTVVAADRNRRRRRSSSATERRNNTTTSGSRSNSRVVEEEEFEDAVERESLLPTRTTSRDHHGDEDNDDNDLWVCCQCCQDRCPKLCCCLAYSWKCIRLTSWPFWLAIKARRTKVTLPLLFLSVVLFGTQMWFSGYTTKWTLNAGESRRILAASWLTKSVGVEVTAPHSTVEIDVFSIAGKCPPLTGQRAQIHRPAEKLQFHPGQYHYDYFYLNKGSQVTAKLDQEEGQSEVYMLEGQDKLATLQRKHSDDDWIDKLVATTHLHWTAKYQRGHYDNPITASFRSIKTDVYTLLYDNPYKQEGELDLDISLDLTTYDLQGYTPVCHDIAVHKCPPVPHKSSFTFQPQCIIMEGVPTNWQTSNNDNVPLKIIEYRNYAFILLLSLAPTIIAILWEFWNCFKEQLRNCQQRRRRQQRTENLPPSYEPPSPPPSPPVATRVRSSVPPPPIPPPTTTSTDRNSKSRASAPPASQDDDGDESIPLVRAESVVPVEEEEDGGRNTTTIRATASSSDSQQAADV